MWAPDRRKKNPPAEVGTINFFCGIIPVKLLNKYPNAYARIFPDEKQPKQIYPIKVEVRHKTRYMYEALSSEEKWVKGEKILLPPGLVFKKISPRYFNSNNPKTQIRISNYVRDGII